jgi:hypothetical protein
MSGIDPWAIWLIWMAGFTLIIWGTKPGGQRVHGGLMVAGNAILIGLALWRPEVRFSVAALLILSVVIFRVRHSAEEVRD